MEILTKMIGLNYQNWDCIEFDNPINIFQLLPDDLRRSVFKYIGKRILYTSVENYEYNLNEPERHRNYGLPQDALKFTQNKEADCDIFAAVVDTDKDLKNVFSIAKFLKDGIKTENYNSWYSKKNYKIYKTRM